MGVQNSLNALDLSVLNSRNLLYTKFFSLLPVSHIRIQLACSRPHPGCVREESEKEAERRKKKFEKTHIISPLACVVSVSILRDFSHSGRKSEKIALAPMYPWSKWGKALCMGTIAMHLISPLGFPFFSRSSTCPMQDNRKPGTVGSAQVMFVIRRYFWKYKPLLTLSISGRQLSSRNLQREWHKETSIHKIDLTHKTIREKKNPQQKTHTHVHRACISLHLDRQLGHLPGKF